MMTRRSLIGIGALTITAFFILSACSNKPATVVKTATTETKVATTSKTTELIPLTDAINLYQEAYPDTDIISIDLSSQFNTLYYQLEGVNDTTEFQLRINASNKEVQHDREDPLDPEDSNGLKRQNEKLDLSDLATIEEVTTVAENEATSGTATEWELDSEFDTTYWKVTVKEGRQETNVKVDAKSTTVLEVEIDD